MTYQFLEWFGLGMLSATLIAIIVFLSWDLGEKRRRAKLPPPEAIRDLAAQLARLSYRINEYAAGREEERQHAGAA